MNIKFHISLIFFVMIILFIIGLVSADTEQDWIQKGYAFKSKGMFNESIDAFEKVLEINKSNTIGWTGKALNYRKMGLYDEAFKAYDNALEIDPTKYSIWRDKGDALQELGKYGESIESYQKAGITTSGQIDIAEAHLQALESVSVENNLLLNDTDFSDYIPNYMGSPFTIKNGFNVNTTFALTPLAIKTVDLLVTLIPGEEKTISMAPGMYAIYLTNEYYSPWEQYGGINIMKNFDNIFEFMPTSSGGYIVHTIQNNIDNNNNNQNKTSESNLASGDWPRLICEPWMGC